jgi:hypothetical protein
MPCCSAMAAVRCLAVNVRFAARTAVSAVSI